MKPIHVLMLAVGLAAIVGAFDRPNPVPIASEPFGEPIPESAVRSLDYEANPHAGLELPLDEMPDDDVHRALRDESERE